MGDRTAARKSNVLLVQENGAGPHEVEGPSGEPSPPPAGNGNMRLQGRMVSFLAQPLRKGLSQFQRTYAHISYPGNHVPPDLY